ncbi:UDP-forming cellulose synthase catalytic subunit [Paralcaligenes sp. KSB-10]|uniref:UDP-forming cellulose synthase catalytic subunit n=1 Tax=Paralcaligenes sp. KSB-10 TaxID=2901142 RepID=UPI001E5CE577|nr:UDP-forming cellulose synthase catalytic subunit [Paralcaligenes sp. KSB-10]UHL64435.1 UDP-forming cellulose synthase catalytic subunit [Paralcaligenes sp. KSB-10]
MAGDEVMIGVRLQLLLTRPACHALAIRYKHFQQKRQASTPTAALLTLGYLLAYSLLRLDSPSWQAVLDPQHGGFAHLFRSRPKPADPLRYFIQSLWLICVRQPLLDKPSPAGGKPLISAAKRLLARCRAWYLLHMEQIPERISRNRGVEASLAALGHMRAGSRHIILGATIAVTAALAALCITQPFNWKAQLVFVLILWAVAMVVRRMPGRFSIMILVVLSVIVSCRYLWWRYTATLNWDDNTDLFFGITLLIAETHAWVVLMLGYIQTLWPLDRKPMQLPQDSRTWPVVDVLIPTYNEDLSVVRRTVLAATGLDWPKDKLHIYILDDGRRSEFREFADQAGVGYITRPDNRHAKAGNLNHALAQTHGELLALFDCDHIPTRSFLQLTTGWFLQEKNLALVQTPHQFFSPDPFERNLGNFRSQPNENILFYSLTQDGNDTWDATFFCGSCAVLRRSAIDAIGGFAVETVTEDAHTALRLHRAGYSSAYLRIPQAAGLATESLSAHIGQRIRWARGMVQIFRTDNPMLGKGLSLCQRLCYLNATLHFLAGLPRLIFLLAPLAFLLLHAYIIYAPAIAIVLYVLPHMIHASLTSSHMQGQYRHSFWSEVYETVLAWYIAWPTTVALIRPSKGLFNVTAKGGLIDKQYFDWAISRPYLWLATLNLLGIGFGIWRLAAGPRDEILTVIVTMLWVAYNLVIIGAAVAVAAETRQVRQSPRVATELPAALGLPNGHFYPVVLNDYSDNGVSLTTNEPDLVNKGTAITVLLQRGQREFAFAGTIVRTQANNISVLLERMDEHQYRNFMLCTYARADAWLSWSSGFQTDKPLHSLYNLVATSVRGYIRLATYTPRPIRAPLKGIASLALWIMSFLPRPISAPSSSLSYRPAPK